MLCSWAAIRAWMLLVAAALCIALVGLVAMLAVQRMPASPSKHANCR